MNVTIMTKQEVDLQEYYVLRGIRGDLGKEKRVVAEREFSTEPGPADIVKFIVETGCSFVSVVKNYRIVKDDEFPFA